MCPTKQRSAVTEATTRLCIIPSLSELLAAIRIIISLANAPYLACTIPSINAVKLESKQSRDYLPDSIPLSYQVMGKYLEGFDLTYDADLFGKISRGESYGNFLVSIVDGYPDQTIDADIQVNTDVWEVLDS